MTIAPVTGEASLEIDKRSKAPKGTFKVENNKGWLRLRFSHGDKRYAFAPSKHQFLPVI